MNRRLGIHSAAGRLFLGAALMGLLAILSVRSAHASPWAEVGDAQLRSDIEILAAAGAIDDVTMQWPLPWAGIVARLENGSVAGQPDYVRDAAERVLARARSEMHLDRAAFAATADATNDPNVIHSFDGLSRETFQAQVSGEYMTQTAAIRINAGAQIDHKSGHAEFMPDGSYAAITYAGVLAYAGYVTHWWGPGWISALSLSNNARPMPQIGLERLDTAPIDFPVLRWLGPTQTEFFIGWLDDSRVATNTVFVGTRTEFNPAPGLEIGIARVTEMCGKGHDCKPIADYFNLDNGPGHVNKTNDESNIDIRYTNTVSGHPFEIYAQMMSEDSNPISHSITSHLFGASVWFPIRDDMLRITAEYADTVPTINIFSFGNVAHGSAYNNSDYVDGMRYRGRTLGFGLDSDSRLLTIQSSFSDSANRTFTFTFDHAQVSNPNIGNVNVVTTAPVLINLFEARATIPYRGFLFDLAARIQDDQPRPDHGFTGSVEAAARIPF